MSRPGSPEDLPGSPEEYLLVSPPSEASFTLVESDPDSDSEAESNRSAFGHVDVEVAQSVGDESTVTESVAADDDAMDLQMPEPMADLNDDEALNDENADNGENADNDDNHNNHNDHVTGPDGRRFQNFIDWARAHPAQSIALGISTAAVVAPMSVAAPLLGLAGFTSSGVATASFAAGWQAGIGNVAAGSIFAVLQSAGAGGVAGTAAVGSAIGGAGAAGILSEAISFARWLKKTRQETAGS